MATNKVTRVKLYLDDGKTAVINIAAPIGVTGSDIAASTYAGIAGAFETDDGATVKKIDISSIETTVNTIKEAWDGTAPKYDEDDSPSE